MNVAKIFRGGAGIVSEKEGIIPAGTTPSIHIG